jgi:hypothetical protein
MGRSGYAAVRLHPPTSSFSDDLSELVGHVVDDLAITVAAALLKPRDDALNVEPAFPEKFDSLAQRVVALWRSLTCEVVEQGAQVFVRQRNGSNEIPGLMSSNRSRTLCTRCLDGLYSGRRSGPAMKGALPATLGIGRDLSAERRANAHEVKARTNP